MTKELPYLSEIYGLMPWHFGGDERLTDAEINSYLKHYQEKKKHEESATKKTPRSSSSPRRSPSRRPRR